MSNKIYKKLIVGEIEEITELQNTDKILVSSENGEIKEVDKSLIGGGTGGVTEDKVNELINNKQALLVNSTGGYSHKYRKDNPTYYGGEVASNSIDLTFSTLETTTGINGANSFGVGINNIAHSTSSLILGFNSLTFAPYTGVIGGDGNMIGYGGDIDDLESTTQFAYIYGGKSNNIINGGCSTIISGKNNVIGSVMQTSGTWNSNSLIGGESNTIIMSEISSIIGGAGNRIATNSPKTFDENSKNGYNTIIGGKANSIVSSMMGTRPAFASVILGGENNSAQGYYNVVAGIGNYAVTLGETIFGIYSTQQAPFMSGYTRLPNARIFNIGVGTIDTPADGLCVFVNGLVTAPSATNELIDSESTGKALITKEYFDANKGQQTTQEFVKNKSGWSLSHAIKNPTYYGVIGLNAINLSVNEFASTTGATGRYSFTIGNETTASGLYSFAGGNKSVASESSSFAYGTLTTASGGSAFAINSGTTASGLYSFASGNSTTASGEASFASGYLSKANGKYSFASGRSTTATGEGSFVIGYKSKTNGLYSFATGFANTTTSDYETVVGYSATAMTNRVFGVGCGDSEYVKKDGLNVMKTGLVTAPSLTTTLINDDTTNKVLITKEYLDSRLTSFESSDNNMTSSFGQSYMSNVFQTWSTNRGFSNLSNVSIVESITDGVLFNITTFDGISTTISVRENGLSGVADYSNLDIENDLLFAQRAYVNDPNTLIKILTSATVEQKNQIKSLLGL